MCSYCGCESEKVIAQLMDDHATIALMAGHVEEALAGGDRQRADDTCAEIARLFYDHGGREERGLFAELQADPLAASTVAELERDHLHFYSALAEVPGLSPDGVRAMLADLLEHANREDTDVFPAALQVLPNEAWERVAKVHEASVAVGAIPGDLDA